MFDSNFSVTVLCHPYALFKNCSKHAQHVASNNVKRRLNKASPPLYTGKNDQVDAKLFAEQRLNNIVIKVQQHLLN